MGQPPLPRVRVGDHSELTDCRRRVHRQEREADQASGSAQGATAGQFSNTLSASRKPGTPASAWQVPVGLHHDHWNGFSRCARPSRAGATGRAGRTTPRLVPGAAQTLDGSGDGRRPGSVGAGTGSARYRASARRSQAYREFNAIDQAVEVLHLATRLPAPESWRDCPSYELDHSFCVTRHALRLPPCRPDTAR
jgi:hypothetical protein